MDGVTILNSYTINGALYAILLFAGAAILSLCWIRDFAEGENARGVLILILSLIASGIGALFLFVPPITRYEVTINDDVTLKEFQERYKIVKQRGDIYIVEERADANE